jgi:hypothetical protein
MMQTVGQPQFVRIDLTPTWWGSTLTKARLAPVAVGMFFAHELRGMHREIRLHFLEGMSVEVANVVIKNGQPFDVLASAAALKASIERLADEPVVDSE